MLVLLFLPVALTYVAAARTHCIRAVCIGYDFAGSLVVGGWMVCGILSNEPRWVEAALFAQGLAMYLPMFWSQSSELRDATLRADAQVPASFGKDCEAHVKP